MKRLFFYAFVFYITATLRIAFHSLYTVPRQTESSNRIMWQQKIITSPQTAKIVRVCRAGYSRRTFQLSLTLDDTVDRRPSLEQKRSILQCDSVDMKIFGLCLADQTFVNHAIPAIRH